MFNPRHAGKVHEYTSSKSLEKITTDPLLRDGEGNKMKIKKNGSTFRPDLSSFQKASIKNQQHRVKWKKNGRNEPKNCITAQSFTDDSFQIYLI